MSDGLTSYVTIPDCSAVSQLQTISKDDVLHNGLSDVLILVSQPNPDTTTGYISKSVKFESITDALCAEFGIETITTEQAEILEQNKSLADFVKYAYTRHGVLSAQSTPSPYIISSINQTSGFLDTVNGYRLRDGMQTEFNTYTFNNITSKQISATDIIMNGEPLSDSLGKVTLVRW